MKLYEPLSDLLGGETLPDKLNVLIRQCFFPIPAMASFLHGLTRQLVDTLTQRDMETSRLVVQLVFHNNFPITSGSCGDA